MLTQSSKVSGWLSRSYYEAKGFLILIKKKGDLLDKIIGYSYFILRVPYYLILLILKKREKDRVLGYCLGCYDFFLNKKLKQFLWCGRRDLNSHELGSHGPQPCLSTSFSTTAYYAAE